MQKSESHPRQAPGQWPVLGYTTGYWAKPEQLCKQAQRVFFRRRSASRADGISDPDIIRRSQSPTCIARIDCPGRFDQQDFAFVFGIRFMFCTSGDNQQLTCMQVHLSIPKLDAHVSFKHNEHFVGLSMTVPNKLSLDFDQFEVIIIHLGDDFG